MATVTESLKNTPNDVSEFEREQLRFFLAGIDTAAMLVEVNPSLAWLPKLAELKLLNNEAALAAWVERNFSSAEAVREVVANLRFFSHDSADILEYRLNAQQEQIEAGFEKCWRLIIRHIRNMRQGVPRHEWFEVLPRLKRNDYSADTLNRVVSAATPKLRVERRYGWHDEHAVRAIKEPFDLLRVQYGVENGVNEGDFFEAWPSSAPAQTEDRLASMLTHSLEAVLADAQEVGVERNDGLSISDIDVPSVAAHEQNAYRRGFFVIVRLIAELWSRLIKKDKTLAASMLRGWARSPYRLIRRLALFAAADERVAPAVAAKVLVQVTQGELFLTNSVVEVHRLVRARWTEFSVKQRAAIERRIVLGPPREWFRGDASIEDVARLTDRKRFELLVDVEKSGAELGPEAQSTLQSIRERYPKWDVTEPERLGFLMWSGGATHVGGNMERLEAVPAKRLLRAAQKTNAEAAFMDGDAWQALCQSEPLRAFQGIVHAAPKDRWQEWAWRPLFWQANTIVDADVLHQIATLFVQWPESAPFEGVSDGAAWWLDEVCDKLKANALWSVWDLIEKRAPRSVEVRNSDPYGTAINDASGHLTTILLKRTPKRRGKSEFNRQLRLRYNKLISERGTFGLLVRVRLAAAVTFLFGRAPAWTTENVVPLFDWSSSDAAAMWSARKYQGYIGSPDLFLLTKVPFLALFARAEPSAEDRRVFADWLGVILIANRAGRAKYPLTPIEVRSVLRRAGHETLSSFAHRLAIDMESAKSGEKLKVWNDYVGPVFEGAWPLDVDLQSNRETFKLVQLLRASGSAFPMAVDVVLPFIRAENPRMHTSVFSLAEAGDELYQSAPIKMLDLISAIVGDASDRSFVGLQKALDKLKRLAPDLTQINKFKKLETQAFG